nr:hypothetical protein [Hyphomonas sp. 34-62-18]
MLSPADFDLLFGRSGVRPEPKIRPRPAFATSPARQAVKVAQPRGRDRL